MKTTFERYIDANNALVKCYQAVSFDKYQGLSASDKDALCLTERESVRSFLVSNQVGFANLLKERLAAAGQK